MKITIEKGQSLKDALTSLFTFFNQDCSENTPLISNMSVYVDLDPTYTHTADMNSHNFILKKNYMKETVAAAYEDAKSSIISSAIEKTKKKIFELERPQDKYNATEKHHNWCIKNHRQDLADEDIKIMEELLPEAEKANQQLPAWKSIMIMLKNNICLDFDVIRIKAARKNDSGDVFDEFKAKLIIDKDCEYFSKPIYFYNTEENGLDFTNEDTDNIDLYYSAHIFKRYDNLLDRNRRASITRSQRYRILNRDHFTCQKCGAKGPGAGGTAELEVDHKRPYSLGGSDDDDNLWTLCDKCNGGKSNNYID